MSDVSVREPGIGHNLPDWKAEETARLKREFETLEAEEVALLDDARAVPKTIENQETANTYTVMIGRLRNLRDRIEKVREGEKAPHFRRGQAVDSFFNRMKERLERKERTDPAGAVDVLLARLNDYNARRLAEEQRRRDEAARLAREEANRAAAEADRLAQQQRDAEAAARRARKPETVETRKAEADRLAEETARAASEAQLAHDKASEAVAEAAAKPADMVREHHEGGAINTMKLVWHIEITDEMQLDAKLLWPFVKADAKLAALKEWAKITQHKRAMTGAVIEQRAETDVRR